MNLYYGVGIYLCLGSIIFVLITFNERIQKEVELLGIKKIESKSEYVFIYFSTQITYPFFLIALFLVGVYSLMKWVLSLTSSNSES